MALHVGSMLAFFLDTVAQAPMQIQCVQQGAPEPWLKWLLPTIVQTVVSLASITAGVWIALWSFRATSKKDHARWVIDQKRAEWKELLIKVTAIEEIVPCIVTGLPGYPDLEPAVRAILPLLRGNIFIYQTLESSDFIGRWASFLKDVSGEFEMTIKGDNLMQKGLLPEPTTWDDRERSAQGRRAAELEIRQKLYGLREELHTLAHKELKI